MNPKYNEIFKSEEWIQFTVTEEYAIYSYGWSESVKRQIKNAIITTVVSNYLVTAQVRG